MANFVGFNPNTRGVLHFQMADYGESALGSKLRYAPCKRKCKYLVVAAIHGEEAETSFFLSRALRAFDGNFDSIAFVLCANPDGVSLGVRGNARDVDLNRNFPTSNWKPLAVSSRSILESSRDTLLSPGEMAGSEPETKALMELVDRLDPQAIVSIHSPLGCVDAPEKTSLVCGLQQVFNVPWVADVGYPTPGSLGSWCKERGVECVTMELPRLHGELLFERYGIAFANFLKKLDT